MRTMKAGFVTSLQPWTRSRHPRVKALAQRHGVKYEPISTFDAESVAKRIHITRSGRDGSYLISDSQNQIIGCG